MNAVLYESISTYKKLNFSVFLVWLSLFSAHEVTVESTRKNPVSFGVLSCVNNCASKRDTRMTMRSEGRCT